MSAHSQHSNTQEVVPFSFDEQPEQAAQSNKRPAASQGARKGKTLSELMVAGGLQDVPEHVGDWQSEKAWQDNISAIVDDGGVSLHRLIALHFQREGLLQGQQILEQLTLQNQVLNSEKRPKLSEQRFDNTKSELSAPGGQHRAAARTAMIRITSVLCQVDVNGFVPLQGLVVSMAIIITTAQTVIDGEKQHGCTAETMSAQKQGSDFHSSMLRAANETRTNLKAKVIMAYSFEREGTTVDANLSVMKHVSAQPGGAVLAPGLHQGFAPTTWAAAWFRATVGTNFAMDDVHITWLKSKGWDFATFDTTEFAVTKPVLVEQTSEQLQSCRSIDNALLRLVPGKAPLEKRVTPTMLAYCMWVVEMLAKAPVSTMHDQDIDVGKHVKIESSCRAWVALWATVKYAEFLQTKNADARWRR
jgi:hypothetical protein